MCYVKNKARLTGQTAPGRRFPGHWPTPWRGSADRVASKRTRAAGRFFFTARFFTINDSPPDLVAATQRKPWPHHLHNPLASCLLPKRVRPTCGVPRTSATKGGARKECRFATSPLPLSDVFFYRTHTDRQTESEQIRVITSGGDKHGPTGQLAEPWHRWPSAGRPRPIGREQADPLPTPD